MLLANLVRYRAGTFKDVWDGNAVILHSYVADAANHFGVGLVAVENEIDCEKVCQICDGLIVPGNANNIDPKHYGGVPVDPAPERDEYPLDARVIAAFAAQNKPIFGICGGLQALNVFYGGTLGYVKDLKSEPFRSNGAEHDEKKEIVDAFGHTIAYTTHMINVKKDSFVYDVFGQERVRVNTYHGQAIDRLAEGFSVVATSDDGIIEAVENKEKKIFAVQWHPELAFRTGDEVERKFFENFIRLCRENKK